MLSIAYLFNIFFTERIVEKMGPDRTIIDTDILIDFVRNRKESVEFVTQLETKKTILSSTAINAFELSPTPTSET